MASLFEDMNLTTNYDQHFVAWRDNKTCSVEQIDQAYNTCKHYLDSNFKIDFQTSFFSRLWELYICQTLLSSPAYQFLKPTNGEGPDFVLEKFCNNKNVYIECVCPQDAGSEGEGKNVIDERYITSRFSGAIKSKADYFKENYQCTEDHYKVLCVSGAVMSLLKGKRNNSDDLPSTLLDFESAVCPHIFWVDKFVNFISSSIYSEPTTVKFPKGDKIISVGHQDYLDAFDAIIFSDILPFNTKTSGNIFSFCFNSDAPVELRQIIKDIFK